MALSMALGRLIYDENHYLLACQSGRKEEAGSLWFDTTLPLIICQVLDLRLDINV